MATSSLADDSPFSTRRLQALGSPDALQPSPSYLTNSAANSSSLDENSSYGDLRKAAAVFQDTEECVRQQLVFICLGKNLNFVEIIWSTLGGLFPEIVCPVAVILNTDITKQSKIRDLLLEWQAIRSPDKRGCFRTVSTSGAPIMDWPINCFSQIRRVVTSTTIHRKSNILHVRLLEKNMIMDCYYWIWFCGLFC